MEVVLLPGEKLITHKCKVCHEPFTITESHAKWFDQKGLPRPKRCPNCLEMKHLQAEMETQ